MDKLLEFVMKVADDKLAQDMVVLDFRWQSAFTDYFIIASSFNEQHASAIVDEVEAKALNAGYDVIVKDKQKGSGWFLIDIEGVVLHVFYNNQRSYYGLEELWKDLLIQKK